jgi:hypothetical protein
MGHRFHRGRIARLPEASSDMKRVVQAQRSPTIDPEFLQEVIV